ncbi:MAG: heme lyase CcmF/NrfE family subunit [Phycisphaerales bacterium]|nr:heme lyase CcmF/NrfE family subunit [Phycisphaerales bacterium]
MIPTIGTSILAVATLACMAVIIASLAAVRLQSSRALSAARWGVGAFAACLTAASALLLVALLQSDFRLAYVASYTERALPVGFKFAAFWAGQEGSLLLWGGMIAWMSTIAIVSRRANRGTGEAVTIGVLGAICGFFGALLLFAANPFEVVTGLAPADGKGLNPQLQDLAMIIHPPTLFLGYAGFAIPFAVMIGAMAERRTDARWLTDIRRWVLFSWVTLGAGIMIGAWWAYIELGWGGYWGWDPVENASLLPWLTGTALLHSVIMQDHRGVFKRWNVALVATSFILCIFGTYITRSGVVSSVHSFGESLVGTFFFAFIILLVVGSAAVFAWRWSSLAPQRRLSSMLEREGVVLIANVLLVIMTAITLLGTMWPVISRTFANEMTVGPKFYNNTVAPIGLVLIGLMATAPALVYGHEAGKRLGRSLIGPGIAGAALTAAAALLGVHNIWALLVTLFAAVTVIAVLVHFAHCVRAERAHSGAGALPVAWRLLDSNHRRWGGFVVHLGVALMVIGFAGSSLFPEESTHQVGPGESFQAGRYTLKFNGLEEVPRENYTAVVASIEATLPGGKVVDVSPERRFYDKRPDEPSAQVAVRSNWREDLYLILAGWEAAGKVTAIKVIINPLTMWIWIGSTILVIGSIICMLPRLSKAASAASNGKLTQEGRTKGMTPAANEGSSMRPDDSEDSTTSGGGPRRRQRPATAPAPAAALTRAASSTGDLRTGPAAPASCPS